VVSKYPDSKGVLLLERVRLSHHNVGKRTVQFAELCCSKGLTLELVARELATLLLDSFFGGLRD
jgi:hypothetical protein